LSACATKGYKIDPRSAKALEVKRAWLAGKATDKDLAAAWAAARAAAWAAAWDAAWDAQNKKLEEMLQISPRFEEAT